MTAARLATGAIWATLWGTMAVATMSAACTRTVYSSDLCELVESYETGAPRDAYVECGEQGEALPCDGDLTGQAASKGAIEAAFSACIPASGSHPTAGMIGSAGLCNDGSRARVYGISSGWCEVSAW